MFGSNDAPVAEADTNWVQEDTTTSTTGNVLDDVAHGGSPHDAALADADAQLAAEEITPAEYDAIVAGLTTGLADVEDTDVDIENLTVVRVDGSADSVGEDVNGTYGTLNLAEGGGYTYTLYSAADLEGLDPETDAALIVQIESGLFCYRNHRRPGGYSGIG